MELSFVYPGATNFDALKRAAALGDRPDGWPYGINQLAHTGPRGIVSAQEPTRPTPWSLLRAVSRTGGNTMDEEAVITWDEWTATKELGRPRLPRLASGVIWLTDKPRTMRDHLRQEFERRALVRAEALWALTRPQVDMLPKLLGRGAPPVDFLKFGIDTNFFAPHPPVGRPTVLSAGGDRDRDAETLFKALSIVHQRVPDAQLLVQTNSQARPPAGVTLLGHMPHASLRRLYANSTLIAIATRPNNHVSGMTVALEAMSSGRPVVMTRTPGVEDYVQDGLTGALTRSSDPIALAEEVVRMLEHQDEAARLGAAARRYVVKEHSTTVMIDRLDPILGRVGL